MELLFSIPVKAFKLLEIGEQFVGTPTWSLPRVQVGTLRPCIPSEGSV
jgi:hypothetical protein